MSKEITPLQTLGLWWLLVRGGSGLQKEMNFGFEKQDREALVAAGLISAVQNERRAFVLEVTDKGWHEARTLATESNIGKTRSPAAGGVLQGLLARLGAYMRAKDIPLAEILAEGPLAVEASARARSDVAPAPPPAPPAWRVTDLRERIRTAFLKLTGGQFNTRVRLAELRPLLADLDRATQDEAILAVAREPDADLLQLDNRIDITDADHEAALRFGTEPRHLLWISK